MEPLERGEIRALGIDVDYLYVLRGGRGRNVLSMHSCNLLTKQWHQLVVKNVDEFFPSTLQEDECFNEMERNYENACFVSASAAGASDADCCFFLLYRVFVDTRPRNAAHPGDEDYAQFIALHVYGQLGECTQLDVVDTDGTLRKHAYKLSESQILCGSRRQFYFVMRSELNLPDSQILRDGFAYPKHTCYVLEVFELTYCSGRAQWLWKNISHDANIQCMHTGTSTDALDDSGSALLARQVDSISSRSPKYAHAYFAAPQFILVVPSWSTDPLSSVWLDKALLFDVRRRAYSMRNLEPDPVHGWPLAHITSRLEVANNKLYFPGEESRADDFENIPGFEPASAHALWTLDLDAFRWTRMAHNAKLHTAVYAYSCIFSIDTHTLFVFGGLAIDQDAIWPPSSCGGLLQTVQLQPLPLRIICIEAVYRNTFSNNCISSLPFEPRFSRWQQIVQHLLGHSSSITKHAAIAINAKIYV